MAAKIPEAQARALFIKNKLEPLGPFPGTQKPWKSKCLITGKTVSPTYGKVRDFGHRCKYCSGFEVDIPEAIKLMKSKGLIPLVKYPGANKPWKCKCKVCGKFPAPSYTNIKNGSSGCAYCSKRKVDYRDAVALMKARGFKTFGKFPGSLKPWNVQCLTCKRKFSTYFYSTNDKTRCKYCTGAVVDEQMTQPILAKLKLSPLEKFPGAKKPWKMRCQRCNRVVTPSWTHLTRTDRNVGGCVFCSKRRVHMDDMLELLKENKLKPVGQFINGKTPWICQCLKCKREVFPRINDLRAGLIGVGFHSLRHTTASLLISQGTPVVTVSKILGHSSTQMTLDVYGHLYADDAALYLDRLGDSVFNTGTDKERTNVFTVTQKVSS